jgi:hypothetical protein
MEGRFGSKREKINTHTLTRTLTKTHTPTPTPTPTPPHTLTPTPTHPHPHTHLDDRVIRHAQVHSRSFANHRAVLYVAKVEQGLSCRPHHSPERDKLSLGEVHALHNVWLGVHDDLERRGRGRERERGE